MSDKPYNPWREFIENVINGDNEFRTQEYYDLLDDIDARIAREAELVAEVERLRGELRVMASHSDDAHARHIARNALGEG